MFRLSAEEKAEVVANCDHLAKLKYSPTLPYAFTKHGAFMLASNAELSRKLVALEKNYDVKFKAIFEAIRELMTPSNPKKKRPIGFAPCEKK